ncbi:serpin family protein [Clostridium luticellarii]|jgi:serpin B|uniref:serpin family protein n=1 Tax=Clostridium luticellarii TaxID=1691940 RepID=UPI002356FCA2|nr:serpin family protein [Clostridium luticellarii]MCI1945889.1 serpin family protein [Clostridium luticellarii]MCI1969128.1 serpin family protein [Clostridium luticellarii]MCI1996026.1 serpin family protein [Clostridium luticellarii]MCI2040554.1 serpin family protein [Clostridium luticellarii]
MNKSEFKKIISMFLFVSFITIFVGSTSNVHADPSYSAEKAQIQTFEDKKDVSTVKCWTIKLKYPVDKNYLSNFNLITVKDPNGLLLDTKLSTSDDGKYIYVSPPEGGYESGQSYYINISKDLKFIDKTKSLKNPVQMKFTTTNMETINIDENSPISKSNNIFSFNLIKNLADKDKDENMIISPLSISSLLSMTQNGESGKAKQEILNCIGLKDVSDNDINLQYYSLFNYYNNLKSTDLQSANSIWLNKQISFNDDFKNKAQKYYDSQINSEDFNDSQTVNKINQWVDQSTKGQIKKIIDTISSDDAAILINSIYFKGTWLNKFSPYNTKKEQFTLSDGKKIDVDNMENTSYVNYVKGTDFQAISLPYYDNMEMDIFLPNTGINADDFLQSITAENFNKWTNDFKRTYVAQKIPKFKIEYGTDLKDVLKALGMNEAFDVNNTDSKVIEGSSYISDIRHKACIDVNEQGTKAAAVTSEIVATASPTTPPKNPVDFKVNRPFIFTIRDNKTGIVLFIGKVENPTADN